MDVTPLVRQGAQIIQSYAGGVFKISGQSHDGPVIVTAQETKSWSVNPEVLANAGQGGGLAPLSFEDFSQVIEVSSDFDVFLCGTGKGIKFLSPDVKNALKSKGVSFDMMDSGAASRTYNVLMAEGRRVVALLLPVVP